MSLTIGLAGMDPATEAALKAALMEANERLAGRWQLLPETQADHIVVDMDSMYGPMSWLRLHASGKRVVGLTSAMRTQTDFRLGRPFSADSLTALLEEIAGGGAGGTPTATGEAAANAPAAAQVPVAAAPAAQGAQAAEEAVDEVAPAVAAADIPEAVPAPAPTPAPAPEPDPEPQPAAAPTTLFGWLASGSLGGRKHHRVGIAIIEVGNRTTIGHYMAFKSHFAAQNILQKVITTAGRLAVHPIVSAHHGLDRRFFYGCAKSRQIGFV